MGSYSRVTSRVTIVMTQIRGRITPFIATHEPPSKGSLQGLGEGSVAVWIFCYRQ